MQGTSAAANVPSGQDGPDPFGYGYYPYVLSSWSTFDFGNWRSDKTRLAFGG